MCVKIAEMSLSRYGAQCEGPAPGGRGGRYENRENDEYGIALRLPNHPG